ncbi:hypothetical protein P6166_15725 [Stenotrophomonas sp. HITSZ_GD]|uniref:hypothetical protein n=1 Tax=Stenotrophomonas sp. HITSZ_GD TaxID=3037248 RepID=UPI00240E0922|nr:hypothetical protein [Stenotrophomonas sp. HITSZ_GD]MDG2526805.1 hypothetical protein [Stenotrophomonas sp. HITSZ_GD]
MATPVEEGTPRRRVVLIWCCLLVLVAVVIQAARVGAQRERRDGPDRPWIGLPSNGTDITGWDARRAVEERLHADAPAGSLAAHCGGDAALPAERYVGRIAPGQGLPPLQVVIDVAGDQVTLSPPSGTRWPERAAQAPQRFQRGELKGIREAWTTALLWGQAMPEPVASIDPNGASSRLEACVAGNYALRTGTYAPDVKALYAALAQAIARH